MNKGQICVTIPLYKEILNDYEVQSIRQCIKVLSSYTIYFVCTIDLNKVFYEEKFPEIINYAYFDDIYFKDLNGYNQLLLSSHFYKAFKFYEYMLIYQTDSYVFKDELLNWVDKGYDYIGGVLYDGFGGNPESGAQFWCPGNGGFSLRKIKTMIRVLMSNKKLKNWDQLMEEKNMLGNDKGFKALKYSILFILKALGYKNSIRFYAKQFDNNEDVFFINLSLKYNLISMPKIEKAILFSWDRRPEVLFNKLEQLPFGCHAWYRNDGPYEGNKEFWSKKIK